MTAVAKAESSCPLTPHDNCTAAAAAEGFHVLLRPRTLQVPTPPTATPPPLRRAPICSAVVVVVVVVVVVPVHTICLSERPTVVATPPHRHDHRRWRPRHLETEPGRTHGQGQAVPTSNMMVTADRTLVWTRAQARLCT